MPRGNHPNMHPFVRALDEPWNETCFARLYTDAEAKVLAAQDRCAAESGTPWRQQPLLLRWRFTLKETTIYMLASLLRGWPRSLLIVSWRIQWAVITLLRAR